MKLSEMEVEKGQTILAVGPSGSGKSIAMCSYPGPLLNLCLDGRMKSVAQWFKGTPQLDQIEYEEYHEFEPLNDRIDSLENYCPYKTVMLDPISFLSSILMRYSFSKRGEGKGQSKGRQKGIIELTTIEDFGVEHQGIEGLVSNLKIAGKKHGANIIVVAHVFEATYTKEGGKESHVAKTILTQGKRIAALLPGMFDEVYSFYVDSSMMGEPRYKMRTYADATVGPARSSFIKMPKEIDWTNAINFYDYVKQFYTGD